MGDIILTPERVIAGRNIAPEIVVDSVVKLPINSTVLDIGAGDARLANSVNPLRPDIKIIGLDYDFSLTKSMLANHPDANPVNADANFLPFRNESMNMAVAINTMHEACPSPEYQERLLQFRRVIGEINRVLDNNGEIVLFDGVDTLVDNPPVIITPKSDDARKRLETFNTDYPAHETIFAGYKEGYRSDLQSVVLLQTKYGYIGRPVWPGERVQLYPFLEQKDILKVLQPFFGEVKVAYPKGRIGVEKFLNDFEIIVEDGETEKFLDTNNFPQTQIFLHARK